MTTGMLVSPIICLAVWTIFVALIMSTKNIRSTIFFKFIPLMLGFFSLLAAFKIVGTI